MLRTDVLNRLIERHDYHSYLEIGVWHPSRNFAHILARQKLGVDPFIPRESGILTCTSDDFFSSHPDAKFDLIFVDGDHRFQQVEKDVRNAVQRINAGGAVVMHDCYPKSEAEAAAEKLTGSDPWCGGAYRVFLGYRRDAAYRARCVDCDHGIGIIRLGAGQTTSIPADFEFAEFLANAREWLGLISPEAFLSEV